MPVASCFAAQRHLCYLLAFLLTYGRGERLPGTPSPRPYCSSQCGAHTGCRLNSRGNEQAQAVKATTWICPARGLPLGLLPRGARARGGGRLEPAAGAEVPDPDRGRPAPSGGGSFPINSLPAAAAPRPGREAAAGCAGHAEAGPRASPWGRLAPPRRPASSGARGTRGRGRARRAAGWDLHSHPGACHPAGGEQPLRVPEWRRGRDYFLSCCERRRRDTGGSAGLCCNFLPVVSMLGLPLPLQPPPPPLPGESAVAAAAQGLPLQHHKGEPWRRGSLAGSPPLLPTPLPSYPQASKAALQPDVHRGGSCGYPLGTY